MMCHVDILCCESWPCPSISGCTSRICRGVTPQAVRRRLISSCTGVAIAVCHGRVMLLMAVAVLWLLVEFGGLGGGG